MPHENRVCLPPCQSKTEIFSLYKQDFLQSHLETISWSAFKKMWRQHFGNVIIPKVSFLQSLLIGALPRPEYDDVPVKTTMNLKSILLIMYQCCTENFLQQERWVCSSYHISYVCLLSAKQVHQMWYLYFNKV